MSWKSTSKYQYPTTRYPVPGNLCPNFDNGSQLFEFCFHCNFGRRIFGGTQLTAPSTVSLEPHNESYIITEFTGDGLQVAMNSVTTELPHLLTVYCHDLFLKYLFTQYISSYE